MNKYIEHFVYLAKFAKYGGVVKLARKNELRRTARKALKQYNPQTATGKALKDVASQTLRNRQVPKKSTFLSLGKSYARDLVTRPVQTIREGFVRDKLARDLAQRRTGRNMSYGAITGRKVKELAKNPDNIVNAAGFGAGLAAKSVLPLPGVGAATELGASMMTRRGLNDAAALRQARTNLASNKAYSSAPRAQRLRMLYGESKKVAKTAQAQRRFNDTVGDTGGFAAGNLANNALQLSGLNVPFQGGFVAMGAVPHMQTAANRLKAGDRVNAIIKDGVKHVRGIPARARMREKKARTTLNERIRRWI